MAAGALVVTLPRKSIQAIPVFFDVLKTKEGLVREWGIANSTLEEVFLTLAQRQNKVNDVAGEMEEDNTVAVPCANKPAGCNRPACMVTVYTEKVWSTVCPLNCLPSTDSQPARLHGDRLH